MNNNSLQRLSEIEEQMSNAGCVEHTKLMEEVKEIIQEAINKKQQEVVDRVFNLLDNITDYESKSNNGTS